MGVSSKRQAVAVVKAVLRVAAVGREASVQASVSVASASCSGVPAAATGVDERGAAGDDAVVVDDQRDAVADAGIGGVAAGEVKLISELEGLARIDPEDGVGRVAAGLEADDGVGLLAHGDEGDELAGVVLDVHLLAQGAASEGAVGLAGLGGGQATRHSGRGEGRDGVSVGEILGGVHRR